MLDKLKTVFKKICTRYTLTIVCIFLLILFGPALIATDLSYLTDWVRSFKMADLYTYLAFIGIISVWSIYGLLVTIKKSLNGITIYTFGLCFLVIAQFLVGFVHIILLYNTYRPILMNDCLQRQPSRFFWWSTNYEDNDQFKQVFGQCLHQWSEFSTERLVSWVVYSVASGLVLAIVIFHKIRTKNEYNEARGYIVSDQEGEWSSTEKPTNASAIQQIPPPPYGDEGKELMDNSMYQQRQRLYDEINKRRKARNHLSRRSTTSNASHTDLGSATVVHPLDPSKNHETYQPPSGQENTPWNRYGFCHLDDHDMLQRQKRFDSHTSERMEYELYKTHEPAFKRRHSSFGERRRSQRRVDSQRKRSARWSNAFSDSTPTPLISNANNPEEEEEEQEEESTKLMKNSE